MRESDAEFAACPIRYPTTEWRALGVRAVDGDTIVVRLDRGFWDVSTMELRLLGIDAVELNSEQGRAARLFSHERVAGAWLRITTRMDPDKYGRILADVLYRDLDSASEPWRNLAVDLRVHGFAKPGG